MFFVWVEEGRDKSCLHVQRILMSIATHTRSISSKVGSYANIVSQRISSWSKGNSLPNKRRIHRLRIANGQLSYPADAKRVLGLH